MTQLRRLRAALTIGVLWGAVWATCGVAIGARRIQFVGPITFSGATVVGVCGFVAGVAFAAVLSRAERARDVPALSSRRSAAYGALGGAFVSPLAALFLAPIVSSDGPFDLSALPPIVITGAAIMATLGALSAIATVRVARRRAPSVHLPSERPPA